MTNSKFPPDLQEVLGDFAITRINRAMDEGSKARRAAELAYRHDDPETDLELSCARFDFAFRVLAITVDELHNAGVFGEPLRAIMNSEINGACCSLDLGDSAEYGLREMLLDHEWGW